MNTNEANSFPLWKLNRLNCSEWCVLLMRSSMKIELQMHDSSREIFIFFRLPNVVNFILSGQTIDRFRIGKKNVNRSSVIAEYKNNPQPHECDEIFIDVVAKVWMKKKYEKHTFREGKKKREKK